jgi:hypothetical protein
VLDDDALDPRNECCLLTIWLSGDILEEVPGCCVENIGLAEPIIKQTIVKVMLYRACTCMLDVAQELFDLLHCGWTWGSRPSSMVDGVDSNLTNSITKELVISPMSKEGGIVIFHYLHLLT